MATNEWERKFEELFSSETRQKIDDLVLHFADSAGEDEPMPIKELIEELIDEEYARVFGAEVLEETYGVEEANDRYYGR